MQVVENNGEQYIYVAVIFHQKWDVDKEKTSEKFSVDSYGTDDGTNTFYFVAPLETGFDAVFDAVEFNVQRNKTKIEKAEIFKEKYTEFVNIFENEEVTPEMLKTLEFNFKGKETIGIKKALNVLPAVEKNKKDK